MRRSKTSLRLVAAGAAAAVALVACGTDGDDTAATPTETTGAPSPTDGSTAGTVSTQTAAAGLRATLTSLLQSHVYLAGIATGQALAGNTAEFEAAAGALGVNTQDLSDAIGSVYGADAGAQFKELWEKHIGFFVDYTNARAAGDDAAAQQAADALDGYRQDFGAFLAGANPEVTAEAVADSLVPHVQTLSAAIDAQADGSSSAFSALRTAAGEMPAEANLLAGAIAAQQGLDGDVESSGAALRAGLTHLLQEHVYLAGIAVVTFAQGGDFDAAAAALGENTQALSDAVGSVYGDDAGAQFKELWEKHIGFFVSYAQAKAGGDEAAATAQLDMLDGYRQDFGAFLASANPEVTADAVAESLVPHVETLAAAIDAVVTGEGDPFALLHEAAKVMPDEANILATAITQQQGS